MGGSDLADLALVSRVDQWVAEHPHLFVVSTARLVRPVRASGTVSGLPVLRARDAVLGAREAAQETGRQREPTGTFRLVDPNGGKAVERGARPLVLALKKVQPTFPSMITVGRTENNDLVVADEQVSKFHAYFRLAASRVELSDAGSRNGTFVGGRRLAAKTESVALSPRDRFSLGALEFQILDARACWEWLRQLDRFG